MQTGSVSVSVLHNKLINYTASSQLFENTLKSTARLFRR